jgi:hypothetical protein
MIRLAVKTTPFKGMWPLPQLVGDTKLNSLHSSLMPNRILVCCFLHPLFRRPISAHELIISFQA